MLAFHEPLHFKACVLRLDYDIDVMSCPHSLYRDIGCGIQTHRAK